MSGWTLSSSSAYCERLARRAAGNFYHAFRLLPTEQRRAMCALYAFLRVADDLSDACQPNEEKRQALAQWRDSLLNALKGEYTHPIYPALRHAIDRFSIPVVHLDEVLTGVTMDLDVQRYATFDELRHYCYHVASAVGLCCIHIWGFRGNAYPPAIAAGLALQLTNILRDIGEDAERGRVYLPIEDLQRFGCKLPVTKIDESFRALMRFEAERAYGFYAEAMDLVELLAPPGRAVFLVMLHTYRCLLDEIVARDFDVFGERVRVSTWRKLWFVAQALPIRWGLLAGRWAGP